MFFEWSDDGRWFLRGANGQFKSPWFDSFEELMEYYSNM